MTLKIFEQAENEDEMHYLEFKKSMYRSKIVLETK